jgi:hypothetical protein
MSRTLCLVYPNRTVCSMLFIDLVSSWSVLHVSSVKLSRSLLSSNAWSQHGLLTRLMLASFSLTSATYHKPRTLRPSASTTDRTRAHLVL